jgi:hypothetical protein
MMTYGIALRNEVDEAEIPHNYEHTPGYMGDEMGELSARRKGT